MKPALRVIGLCLCWLLCSLAFTRKAPAQDTLAALNPDIVAANSKLAAAEERLLLAEAVLAKSPEQIASAQQNETSAAAALADCIERKNAVLVRKSAYDARLKAHDDSKPDHKVPAYDAEADALDAEWAQLNQQLAQVNQQVEAARRSAEAATQAHKQAESDASQAAADQKQALQDILDLRTAIANLQDDALSKPVPNLAFDPQTAAAADLNLRMLDARIQRLREIIAVLQKGVHAQDAEWDRISDSIRDDELTAATSALSLLSTLATKSATLAANGNLATNTLIASFTTEDAARLTQAQDQLAKVTPDASETVKAAVAAADAALQDLRRAEILNDAAHFTDRFREYVDRTYKVVQALDQDGLKNQAAAVALVAMEYGAGKVAPMTGPAGAVTYGIGSIGAGAILTGRAVYNLELDRDLRSACEDRLLRQQLQVNDLSKTIETLQGQRELVQELRDKAATPKDWVQANH
ncbi:MAG: hypothetical protein ABSB74_20685 [Tepidisphaeraceae bacterium]